MEAVISSSAEMLSIQAAGCWWMCNCLASACAELLLKIHSRDEEEVETCLMSRCQEGESNRPSPSLVSTPANGPIGRVKGHLYSVTKLRGQDTAQVAQIGHRRPVPKSVACMYEWPPLFFLDTEHWGHPTVCLTHCCLCPTSCWLLSLVGGAGAMGGRETRY